MRSCYNGMGGIRNNLWLNYIYQLATTGGEEHGVKERFALPTWMARSIEKSVFEKFKKYRIRYYPAMQAAPLIKVFGFVVIRYRIIKIGISKNPKDRINSINRDPRSGYTEYLEVPPIVYFRIVCFIFRRWFSLTIFFPALLLSFLAIFLIVFFLL